MKIPSNKYWIDRAIRLEGDIQNGVNVSIEELVRIYNKSFDDINTEIRKIKNTYKSVDGLTDEELNQYIIKAEQDKLATELKTLYNSTTDPVAKEELQKRIHAQAYKYRITRLEAIESKIYNAIKSSAIKELALTKKRYEDSLKAAYYRTIDDVANGYDVGVSFTVLPRKAIDKALEVKWSGKNFSERVWDNTDQLAKKAQEVIVSGLQTGRTVPQMSKDLDVLKYKGEHSATRLVRTETNYFLNQGTLKGYEDIGFTKYKFIATLDYRTSEVCQGLDRTVHNVEDAVASVNYPPMHPNCRSTTIQADMETGGTKRTARDPLTGKNYKVDKNTTYEQWYNGLTDEQKQSLKQSRRIGRNKSADAKQYEKYKVIWGEKLPNSLEKFQGLKYNNSDEWYNLKAHKQDELNKMNFENMGALVGKLGNKEVRVWYDFKDKGIPDIIDTAKPIEQQAKQAFGLRNSFRTQARDLMANQERRRNLDNERPNLTFEEIIAKKMKEKSMTREESLKDIIKTATKTNADVNKKYGLE